MFRSSSLYAMLVNAKQVDVDQLERGGWNRRDKTQLGLTSIIDHGVTRDGIYFGS